MITFSAPGKIHLLGEHAVVYGKPALLTTINLRLKLTLSPTSKSLIDPSIVPLKNALEEEIKRRFKIKDISNYSVIIHSDIPVGSGHGSSAALCAAFSGALIHFLKIECSIQEVYEVAYVGEKYFHGNPSGGDVAAVTFGGFLWFRKELEQIKIIHSIPQSIHPTIEQFFVINSGKSAESTKEMVEKVAALRKEKTKKIKDIFDDQEELTKQVLVALVDGEHQNLLSIIKRSEHNLEKLGVVGTKARAIIRKIEEIGGAAKISGGGGFIDGSGILIVYHTDSKKLDSLIKKNNWEYRKVVLGVEGLKREEESV